MPTLATDLWQALGENPSAAFVAAILTVLVGSGLFFVPRWLVKVMLRDKDEQIETWKEVAKVNADQARQLTVIGEAQVRILDSIKALAERRDKR